MRKKIGVAITLAAMKDLALQDPADYALNEKQGEKFVKLYKFCEQLTQKYDCEIFRIVFSQQWIDGCIEVLFHGDIEVDNEILNDFRAESNCDALNIATNPLGDDWVQLTFFVKYLWTKNNP